MAERTDWWLQALSETDVDLFNIPDTLEEPSISGTATTGAVEKRESECSKAGVPLPSGPVNVDDNISGHTSDSVITPLSYFDKLSINGDTPLIDKQCLDDGNSDGKPPDGDGNGKPPDGNGDGKPPDGNSDGKLSNVEGSNGKEMDDQDDDDDQVQLDDFLSQLPTPPSTLPLLSSDREQDEDEEDEDKEVESAVLLTDLPDQTREEQSEEGDVSEALGKNEISKDVSDQSDDEEAAFDETLLQVGGAPPEVTAVDQEAGLCTPTKPSHQDPKSPSLTPGSEPQSPWSIKFPPSQPDLLPDHTSPHAYIEQASRLISKAVALESQEDYLESFELFKAGIDLLFNGVKGETDVERHQTVRAKLEGYLSHAEELYKKYIEPFSKDATSKVPEQAPPPFHYLKSFKVVGVKGKVTIVESLITSQKFAIKALYRSSSTSSMTKKSQFARIKKLSPDYIPYMVRLYQHFEVHSGCVLLMLEYVGGTSLVEFTKESRTQVQHLIRSRDSSPENSLSSTKETAKDEDLERNTGIQLSSFAEETPSLTFDPSTPSLDTQCSLTSSIEKESTLELGSLKTTRIQPYKGSQSSIHFTPASRSNSRQGSPSISPLSCRRYINSLERKVKIWAAQIVVCLEHLHQNGIICGDLHPENVLITKNGEVRLTYFGRWEGIQKLVHPSAAANLYQAPELRVQKAATVSCDFWSMGAILFEILCGKTLVSCHPGGLHTHFPLSIPESFSPETESLLQQLLQVNPKERLGTGSARIEEVKSHSFFVGIDWNKIRTTLG